MIKPKIQTSDFLSFSNISIVGKQGLYFIIEIEIPYQSKETIRWVSKLTVKEREEMVGDEASSFGAAMAVVDTDVRGGRRGEHLSLVFKVRVGLHHRDRVVPQSVRLEVRVP